MSVWKNVLHQRQSFILDTSAVLFVSFFFQGYAYTFITADQVRYAGDIIKALELSGSPVPPELEQLWASFKDQQKAVRWGKEDL